MKLIPNLVGIIDNPLFFQQFSLEKKRKILIEPFLSYLCPFNVASVNGFVKLEQGILGAAHMVLIMTELCPGWVNQMTKGWSLCSSAVLKEGPTLRVYT